MKRFLWLLVLTGCPPPPRYIVANVTAANAPVANALVAARCGAQRDNAIRTDEEGRAYLSVADYDHQCTLIVAKPGFPSVETGPVSVCPTPLACAPMRVDLSLPVYENPYDTRFARPPMGVAR